jgi:hypothetical protein
MLRLKYVFFDDGLEADYLDLFLPTGSQYRIFLEGIALRRFRS